MTCLNLIVNVLSTLLLGASNSCAQLLSAPERKDVDKAHTSGTWLDIGVPSVKNLRHISSDKRVLWFFLFATSLPIHMLFNSVVFSEISANDYVALIVTEDFVHGGFWNETDAIAQNDYLWASEQMISDLQLKAQNGTLERLENKECLQAYGISKLESTWSNVLVVTNITLQNTYIAAVSHTANQDDISWVCPNGNPCDVRGLAGNMSTWQLGGFRTDAADDAPTINPTVEYCLATPFPPQCKVKASPPLLLAVIVCNIIKLACLIHVLCQRSFEPLVTIGDAIDSFLKRPDSMSENFRTASIWTGHKFEDANTLSRSVSRPKVLRWGMTSGSTRWVACLALCLIIWICGFCLLLAAKSSSENSLWQQGMGSIDATRLVYPTIDAPLFTNVLIANAPQILVSLTYLFYNNMFTCMLLGHEISMFAAKRKPLRTTATAGQQKSTYFLQLPFRFSIPLMASMATLHWLISRSIFLVQLTVYDISGGINPSASIHACGYAGQPIILTLILGGLMVMVLGGFALRKVTPGIPIMGSSSMAISAACHANPQETKPELLPLMYGVIPGRGLDEQGREYVGFSSREVQPLVPGVEYHYSRTDKADHRSRIVYD